MSESLYVILYGSVVGMLTRATPASELTFQYDPEYLSSGSTVPVSTRLPLREAPYPAKAVTPFLEGLLPENAETRQRWAQRLDTDRSDSFSLLAGMGWDCPGAVQFTVPRDLPAMRERAGELKAVTDDEIGERLRVLRGDDASWALAGEHWSLPGQQGKFTLVSMDGRWHEAQGSSATTHIVKPGIGRLHHQALVEHVTMRAAAMLGVNVASSEYRVFDGQAAIVIQRFDRLRGNDGEVIRLHQEDFCQAVGRTPEDKYEAPRGPTLVDMMKVVRSYSTVPRADAAALADFLAFNYVAGAPDGHSKNIALVLAPGSVRVAPLYDLATSLPYEDPTYSLRQVALSIGGRRKFGQVLPRHWDKASAQLGLPPETVRARVLDLALRFPDALDTALQSVDSPAAQEIRQRGLSRVAEHCQQIIQQLATSSRSAGLSPGAAALTLDAGVQPPTPGIDL